jgi:hypothetical protein
VLDLLLHEGDLGAQGGGLLVDPALAVEQGGDVERLGQGEGCWWSPAPGMTLSVNARAPNAE